MHVHNNYAVKKSLTEVQRCRKVMKSGGATFLITI